MKYDGCIDVIERKKQYGFDQKEQKEQGAEVCFLFLIFLFSFLHSLHFHFVLPIPNNNKKSKRSLARGSSLVRDSVRSGGLFFLYADEASVAVILCEE